MKKVALSVFLILTFAAYAVYQRLNGSSPAPVVVENKQSVQFAKYKNGQFVGDLADAYYGNVQVKAIIRNGKIVDVQFLDYPKDQETSVYINGQAIPLLKQEVIMSQNAVVDVVSGATETSRAFMQSLSSALAKAS